MARSSRRDRRLEALGDRIEDRLRDAPPGLHQVGEPADPQALAQADLPDEAAALWGRWNGLELGNDEVRLWSLARQEQATREAEEAEILREGDRVIGEIGLSLLVLPADPWEEGGEVVMVEEDGERAPYASSVLRMVIGLLAEMQVLYDDEGEYREGLFDEEGQLTARAERRLMRKRLDFDEDAPFARFRLGQLLRRAGELKAARAELRGVIHRAPEFAWAHWELGRVELGLAEAEAEPEAGLERARVCFVAAAEKAGDRHLRALFLAWGARAARGEERERLGRKVLELDAGFLGAREAGVREAIEDGELGRARELLEIGLAVGGRHVGLLELRRRVEAAQQ